MSVPPPRLPPPPPATGHADEADAPAPRFVEPTASLPLRWGAHRPRVIAGLVLLVGGGAVMQLGSVYTLGLLTLGLAASVAGWCVVPAPGWRRCTAVGPGVLGAAALLSGSASAPLLALALAGWLLVRVRPARSYVVVVLPVVAGMLLAAAFPQYGEGVIVDGALGLVVVGGAWSARSLAAWRPRGFQGIFQRRHRGRIVN